MDFATLAKLTPPPAPEGPELRALRNVSALSCFGAALTLGLTGLAGGFGAQPTLQIVILLATFCLAVCLSKVRSVRALLLRFGVVVGSACFAIGAVGGAKAALALLVVVMLVCAVGSTWLLAIRKKRWNEEYWTEERRLRHYYDVAERDRLKSVSKYAPGRNSLFAKKREG